MSDAKQIAIACVQARVTLADYFTAESFHSLTEGLMERAVASLPADVPRLVVFPEDYGSGCMFVGEQDTLSDSSTLRGAVATLVRKNFAAVMGQRLRHRVGWVRAFALHRAAEAAKLYFGTFSDLARKYNAYVLGGSVLLPDMTMADGRFEPQGSDVYNVSYLFGPDGQVLGSQRKAFLIEMEGVDGLDLCAGSVDGLSVIDTELGRIGIAICFDAFQEPVVERFKGLDVDIFLQPSANPGPWNDWQRGDWLNGTWKAVVEEGVAVYGVNPMLVGSLLDVEFEGQSSIVCSDTARLAEVATMSNGAAASPSGHVLAGLDVTQFGSLGYEGLPPRPGFVKVAASWTEAEVLTVTLPHPSLLR